MDDLSRHPKMVCTMDGCMRAHCTRSVVAVCALASTLVTFGTVSMFGILQQAVTRMRASSLVYSGESNRSDDASIASGGGVAAVVVVLPAFALPLLPLLNSASLRSIASKTRTNSARHSLEACVW